jgi:hypothetical protein
MRKPTEFKTLPEAEQFYITVAEVRQLLKTAPVKGYVIKTTYGYTLFVDRWPTSRTDQITVNGYPAPMFPRTQVNNALAEMPRRKKWSKKWTTPLY